MSITQRLADAGITLPEANAPAANYIPYVQVGDLLFVSGQIPIRDGEFVTGKVGADLTVEEGAEAAKLCALSLLSQVQAACGEMDRLKRVVKLTGFVNSTPDFTQQPQVINGASDFLVEALGDDVGPHSRSAVSAGALPLGVAVEIEGIFQLT